MSKSLSVEPLLECVHCGFCLPACPTYEVLGTEMDSPRGRWYLMRGLAEGRVDLTETVVRHLDLCLGCRACETACPSHVPYGQMLEKTRDLIEVSGLRSPRERLGRRALLETLTDPNKLAPAMAAGSVLGRILGSGGTMPPQFLALLLGHPGSRYSLPLPPGLSSIPPKLPAVSRPAGAVRARVGLLAGCVMRVLFHATNQATVRVLVRNGCEVHVPVQGCCGALHAHQGLLEESRAMARDLIDSFERLNLDAIIVNSAGCGSAMKEYGHLLAEDAAYAERALRFSARVKDVCEFLAELGIVPPGPLVDRVTYHDACHLIHGQGVAAQPRALLSAIPGLDLVDLPDADRCCGSAGVYNLLEPEMAEALLERKVANIRATGATIVAAGNPGCLMWVKAGLQADGCDVETLHPVELLDRAYENEPGQVAVE